MFNYSSDLTADSLSCLFTGQSDVLIHENFIDNSTCKLLAEKIFDAGYEHYSNAKSIGRIGMALYETENDSKKLEQYYDSAIKNINYMREILSPYTSPIDLLRCKLEEEWKFGAELERFHGKSMFVGLSRVLEPDVYFLAHHDIVQKDVKENEKSDSIVAQITANIYLQMPESGGEIEIWHNNMSISEFDKTRQKKYGIDPTLLGEPDIVVKPKVGDLILFNSKKLHAVTPPKDISRLTLSCFIGYKGDAFPITYWS